MSPSPIEAPTRIEFDRPFTSGGQVDGERRADAGRRVEVDVTAALLHDVVDLRQAYGAADAASRGQERLEYRRLILLGDAAAGVGGDEAHSRPAAPSPHPFGCRVHGGGERQTAAVRHGVPRMQSEVEHDFFDMARAGLDSLDVAVERQRHADVIAQHAFEDARRTRDHRVDVDHLRRRGLIAAEGEQLFGEPRRAEGGPPESLARPEASGRSCPGS